MDILEALEHLANRLGPVQVSERAVALQILEAEGEEALVESIRQRFVSEARIKYVLERW